MCSIHLNIESIYKQTLMHPHLHIHIPIQTQAHTYSKHQNKTGIIVFFFKTCTDLYIIKFPSNILTIVVFLYKIS